VTSLGGLARRVPAPALFVVSGLGQYVGAALAVGLFAVLPAAGVAWARIAVAAVVLLAWRRPWRMAWTGRALWAVVAFGVVLALMNVTFYLAIERLPLGTAVAIEFAGPVTVATVLGRGARERAGVALAAVGVVLLAGVTLVSGREAALGLVFILAAAACWAGYVVLGRRVALAGDGVTRLAAAMTAGALVLAPVLAPTAAPAFGSVRTALLVLGVALLSSVVPYAVEQVVLRRVSAATFAVLLALLPASAAVVGAVALRQLPGPAEVVGLVCVSVAIALTNRPAGPRLRRGARP
jgi:inner membrane transporter RhtA